MATREENIKEINDALEKLSDEELEKVAGGSWRLTEKEAELAGIKLLKEDGSPGEFTWYHNFGDYYYNDEKISNNDALRIVKFTVEMGVRPQSIYDARRYTDSPKKYKKSRGWDV